MRGRIDALMVVGALVVTVGGSSALAAGAGPAQPPRGISASGEPTPPKPRTSRASQERRVRTFSGQDADAATQTADREFPGFVREKAWRDLSDSPGVRVKRYLSAQSALVDVEGRRAVVQSEMPLSVETGDGARAVDAELVDDGARLRPRRPLAEYTLGEQADTGLLAFGASGLSVGPAGVSARTGRRKGESIVHPNVARDTDLVVKATAIGAQFGWVLRSLDSPTRLRLKVTLRDGDRLVTTSPDAEGPRRGPHGGAVVLRDAKAAMLISPTIAVDADGADVPVEVSVAGDELIIEVTPGAARFPVLVDPFVAEDQRYWVTDVNQNDPARRLDFKGWRFQQGGGAFGSYQGPSGYGNGQYLFSYAGANYATNAFAQWVFDAPYVPGFEAEGAHIFKADFGHTVHTVSDRGSCIGEGIYDRQAGRYEPTGRYRNGSIYDRVFFYPQPGSAYYPFPPYINCGPEGTPGQGQTYGYKVHCLSTCGEEGGSPTLGSPGNLAVLTMIQGGGVPGRGGVVYQGSSLIFMSEQAPPRMTGNAVPAGWTNQPFTLSSTATDYGLGVYRHSASAPGYPGQSVSGNCDGAQRREGGPPGSKNTGDRNTQCPRFGLDLNVPSSDLGEGAYDVTFNAIDVVDNEISRSVPVKIDRTAPDVRFSGTLNVASGQAITAPATLRIAATDASPIIATAGVRRLEIYIDRTKVRDLDVPCSAGGCSLNTDLPFDPASYAEGAHTVTAVATDEASNQRVEIFGLRVMRPRTPGATRSVSADAAPLKVIGAAQDDAAGTSIRGVGDINEDGLGDFIVGAPGADPQGRLNAGAAYVVYGRSGSVSVDLAALTPSTGFKISGATALEAAGSSVAGTGDLNGDDVADFVVGAPGIDALGLARVAGAVYVIFGQAADMLPPSDVDLANLGARGFRIQGPALTTSLPVLGPAVAAPFGSQIATRPASLVQPSGVATDFNGDGLDDLVIGSSGESRNLRLQGGSAYVIFGKTASDPIDVNALGAAGIRIDGAASGDALGTAVAGVNDLNSDGFTEILVGAPGADALGRTDAGAVVTVFGSASPTNVDLAGAPTNVTQAYGPAGSQIGRSIAATGDMDDDAIFDYATSGVSDAYVVFAGKVAAAQDLNSSAAPAIRYAGVNTSGGATAIAGVEDVDGDLVPDLLASSASSGSALVLFGRVAAGTVNAAPLDAKDGFRIAGAGIGGALDSVGDATGDGDSDVLVSAPTATALGRNGAGVASVVEGPDRLDCYDQLTPSDGSYRCDRFGLASVENQDSVPQGTPPAFALRATTRRLCRAQTGGFYCLIRDSGPYGDLRDGPAPYGTVFIEGTVSLGQEGRIGNGFGGGSFTAIAITRLSGARISPILAVRCRRDSSRGFDSDCPTPTSNGDRRPRTPYILKRFRVPELIRGQPPTYLRGQHGEGPTYFLGFKFDWLAKGRLWHYEVGGREIQTERWKCKEVDTGQPQREIRCNFGYD